MTAFLANFNAELMLILTILGLVISEITYFGERVRLVVWITVFGLAAAGTQLILSNHSSSWLGEQTVFFDHFSTTFKALLLFSAGVTIGLAHLFSEISKNRRNEYFIFTLGLTLGGFFVCSANDLMILVIGAFLVWSSSLFLVGFNKSKHHSSEASVKIYFLGILGLLPLFTGVLLIGNLYGVTTMDGVRAWMESGAGNTAGGFLIFFLFFAAICFWIGAFPMHFWVPDVLQGAPLASGFLLSVSFPIMGFSVLFRFLSQVEKIPELWTTLMLFCGVTSMVLSSFLIWKQDSLRRKLNCWIPFYSGLVLLVAAHPSSIGLSSLIFNLFNNLVAFSGIYCALSLMGVSQGNDTIAHLSGKAQEKRFEVVLLILYLLTLIGIPPFPGFLGRLSIVQTVFEQGRDSVLLISLLASIFVMVSYLNVVLTFMKGISQSFGLRVAPTLTMQQRYLLALIIPVFLILVFSNLIFHWGTKSAGLIFH